MNNSPFDNLGAANTFGQNPNPNASGSTVQNSVVQGASTLKNLWII